MSLDAETSNKAIPVSHHYLWHVEVIHKHCHALASWGSVHPPLMLVQPGIDDVLQHMAVKPQLAAYATMKTQERASPTESALLLMNPLFPTLHQQ